MSSNILGVRVDNLRIDDLHQFILEVIRTRRKSVIGHVNIHGINLAYSTPWFREFLNGCDLVFCDGYGIKLGARLLGHNLRERITYADWTWDLSQFCAANQVSLFFLGAQPGGAAKAADNLKSHFPDLIITGTHHGFFNKNPANEENRRVIAEINAADPDILLVGMGMPLQEKWLMENWDHLNARVALTGGAVFDYISGELKRAPSWMTDHGFEWLGRLIIEPGRLWRRYILGNPVFIWRIILQRFGWLKLPS